MAHAAEQAGKHGGVYKKKHEQALNPGERMYRRQLEQVAMAEQRLAKAVAADRQHQVARAAQESLANQLSKSQGIDARLLSVSPQTQKRR